MDDRIEPRFETKAEASLEVWRDTRKTVECTIVNVSSVGYGLRVKEPLIPGETIRIEFQGAHVLVIVRHCGEPANGEYAVGVERVDEWLVGPRMAVERLGAVDAKQPDSRRLLGRPVVKRFSVLHTLAAREMLGLAPRDDKPERRRPNIGLIGTAAAGLVLALSGAYYFYSAGTSEAAPAASAPQSATPVEAKLDGSITDGSIADTSLTDAAQTEPEVYADSAAGAPDSTEASQTEVAALPPSGLPPGADLNAAPAKSPEPTTHTVNFQAHDISWITACADGKKVMEKLFRAGDRAEIQFSGGAFLRSGNAAALDISFGSHEVEEPTVRGAVRAWKFSPEGVEVTSPSAMPACAAR